MMIRDIQERRSQLSSVQEENLLLNAQSMTIRDIQERCSQLSSVQEVERKRGA